MSFLKNMLRKLLIFSIIPLLLIVPGIAFGEDSSYVEYYANIASTQNLTSDSIPQWIKNTAGWWSNDLISDDEFLNAIQYLKDSKIIHVFKNPDLLKPQVSPLLTNDSSESKDELVSETIWYSSVIEAMKNPEKESIKIEKIEGTYEKYTSKIPVVITIIDPLGEKHITETITQTGKYSTSIKIPDSTIPGIYEISLKIRGLEQSKQFAYLEGEEERIPYWIKNNAKWWSEDTISNKEFVSGIQYLANIGLLDTELEDNYLATTLAADKFGSYDSIKYEKTNFSSRKECRDYKIQNGLGTSTELAKCSKIIPKDMEKWMEAFKDEPYSALDESKLVFTGNSELTERIVKDRLERKSHSNYNYGSSSSSYSGSYGDYDYSGYSGYGYSNSDVQWMLERGEYYAQKIINDITPYAKSYVDGGMSWNQYLEKGMAIHDYYSNQYVNEFNSYYGYP